MLASIRDAEHKKIVNSDWISLAWNKVYDKISEGLNQFEVYIIILFWKVPNF